MVQQGSGTQARIAYGITTPQDEALIGSGGRAYAPADTPTRSIETMPDRRSATNWGTSTVRSRR